MTGNGGLAVPPLAVTPASEVSPEDSAWAAGHTQRVARGLLDGTFTGCPHVGSEWPLWVYVAGPLAAYCGTCWPGELKVPLAERNCDRCGSGPAVGWLVLNSPDVPLVLVAAICDACETAGVLGLPRGELGTGR